MKYYQSVTFSNPPSDEWIEYQGYDLEKALAATAYQNSHCIDKELSCETRVYEIDKPYEELTNTDGWGSLSCYDVLSPYTVEELAQMSGRTTRTIYNRAEKLGRLPTPEEAKAPRLKTGRPKKYK